MKHKVSPQIKYICGPVGKGPKDRSNSENPIARGYRAAVAAGRKPLDFTEFGPIDRAVLAEIGRYQAIPHKRKADRERLRAALIPFIQGAS